MDYVSRFRCGIQAFVASSVKGQIVRKCIGLGYSQIFTAILLLLPLSVFCQQPAADEVSETVPREKASVPVKQVSAKKFRAAFPAEMIAAGKTAFQDQCISCHDANRSLDKKKTLSNWRTTVRRMATKDGAEISESDQKCISFYLAAKDQPAEPTDDEQVASPDVVEGVESLDAVELPDENPLSVFGTLSPSWRGGNANLQNPGFLSDAWIGAAWQTTSNPISGRVTACISCHTEAGLGSRIELVEAVVRVDLTKWLNNGCDPCERGTRVAVEAGRIVVPFGAFSQQVNPGVYRTVSKPLIYNMGQRAFDGNLGDPVLPMPYSDEGINISVSKPVWNDVVFNGDFYVVNGLQGGDDGIDFDMSRDYVDNNKVPAVGGRATLGNANLTVGGSLMGGRFNDNTGSGPNARGLYYWIYGADVSYRYKDIFRLQFEYAQRDTDRYVNLPNQLFTRERVGGCYVESELLLSRKYKISLLNRYDMQARNSIIPVGSMPTGSFNVQRYTYGLNYVLPGGSLLMFNVEHWFLPKPLKDIDVLGVRWAATF
jgi:cytochrome c553